VLGTLLVLIFLIDDIDVIDDIDDIDVIDDIDDIDVIDDIDDIALLNFIQLLYYNMDTLFKIDT